MSQFEVPQFIDLESKIVGPLTLKQFGLIAAPSLVAFFLFFVLRLGFWIPIAVVLVGGGVVSAFIKINGRPLYAVGLLALKFIWKPKMFLWKRPAAEEVITIPSLTRSTNIEARRNALRNALKGLSNIGKLWQDITTSKNPIPQREKSVAKKSIGDIKEQFMVFRKVSGAREVAKRVDFR